MSTDAIRAADETAATTEMITGVVADRCANCQAPLAADQRYCVNCGERRGRPRFSGEMPASQPTAVPVEPPLPPHRRHPRLSSAGTLIAGVATLLIAMGVGVLIGHDSNSAPARSADQVITLGGGASAGTGTTAATPSTGTTAASSGKKVKAKPTVVHVTAKTAKAAVAAASKVLGSSANKNLSNNVSQQVGGKCSGGAGCQNGTFTGNFFPSG